MLPCFCLPGGMCVHVLACVPLAISGTAVLMGSHSECLLVRLWVQCCVRCKVCLALSAPVSRWCVFLRHRVVCLVVSFVAQDVCVSGSECLSRLSCAYHGMTFCFCASAGFVCVCVTSRVSVLLVFLWASCVRTFVAVWVLLLVFLGLVAGLLGVILSRHFHVC